MYSFFTLLAISSPPSPFNYTTMGSENQQLGVFSMNELKVFSSTEFGRLGVMLIDGKED